MSEIPTISFEVFNRIQPHEYFRRFIKQNVRPDGRSVGKFRKTTITVGAVSTADGSCMVRVGGTTVVCGIKAEVAEPKIKEPKKGYLVPNVELSPLCSSRFRPGPPPEQAQVASEFLNKILISSRTLDLEDLCIEEGNAVWCLYVDVLCLNYDGNILDAALLSVIGALQNARLPEVTFSESIVHAISPDPPRHPLSIRSFPLCATIAFSPTIGVSTSPVLLADPNSAEEALLSEYVTIALNQDGDLCEVWKTGSGSSHFGKEVMKQCFEWARIRVTDLRTDLAEALEKGTT